MPGTAFVRMKVRGTAPKPFPPTEWKEITMRTRIAIALGLGLALTFAAPARLRADDEGDPTPKGLLGTYTIVTGEDSGQPVPPEEIEGTKVRITPDIIVSTDKDGKEIYVAKFNIETNTKPWKIAMTVSGGPHGDRGRHATGIIELEGDTVRLAYAVEGGVMPTSFKTAVGTKQNAFVLKRIPEGSEPPK